jgi:small subunit ribosomal protein S12e
MSDAGDDVQVDAAPEVEVAAETAPKGKLSVEDALQVRLPSSLPRLALTLNCSKC